MIEGDYQYELRRKESVLRLDKVILTGNTIKWLAEGQKIRYPASAKLTNLDNTARDDFQLERKTYKGEEENSPLLSYKMKIGDNVVRANLSYKGWQTHNLRMA